MVPLENLSTGTQIQHIADNRDHRDRVFVFRCHLQEPHFAAQEWVSAQSSIDGKEWKPHDVGPYGTAQIATRPWKTKPDDDLRKMVPAEEEALNAWIMGALVLDAPPAFLACTHTFLQRMAYVKFFEDCLEGTVVAVVPPRILMPEHIAEKTILMQLLASEPAGSAGYKNLCEWIQNVKRLYYTAATRRLMFIVKEQSIATKWHRREIKPRNEKLVLLSTAKLEEEDDRCDIDNVIPHQADALQYQVRVVAPGLGNDIVGQLIALSTECEVVSIARAPRARDGAYDSNFWVVIFNSEECPPQLKDVTHISAEGFSIFVHHHQRYSRIPCFQCFDPSHPKSKCTRAPGDCQMQFHRDFEPEIKQAKEMSKFELQHMSLEVRQKYIGNLSNSLGKVMANLKTKATEKALLSEMLQPADSSSSTGSAAVAAAANSATDAQSVTPSEAEWFDPANLKKQKGAMKSTISTSATTPVKSSPASKGQPHPASDAASAGRRAPKGGILKAAPKLTSVVGTSPGTVASSGSIGTGSPETSIKASSGQSNRKALQARKKRELELEAILAGKLSSADSVLDGVQANSTQAKQKIAIDARLSAAQATLDIAKEHLSKASSAHTAAAAAAATAKRKFHDVSAKAHSFALDRDEHKEADTSGRDEESSSVNHEAGQFQREIELLDLQQRVTAKEAAAASLILQEAKNAKNRAKRQLDLLKKRAKAKNLDPKDGDQQAGNKASTTAAPVPSPAENTESQGDQDLAYTKLREFVKAHVVHEHSPTAQTQDEEQSRTSQPGSKSFPSASRDNGSANQQPSSEPSADTTSGYSEDPSHFDVTMSLADSTSMDSTMHLQDLTGGAVTPPNGQATLPLPAEVTKAFHQEMRSQNGTEDAGNGAPSMNQPTPGSADQEFGHIDSAESRDADPTSVFGSGPEINAAMGSGLVLKAAASTTSGQSEASQESTFSNDSESGEFETPPSSPSHSVQDDGQARKSLVERLVGSKEELEQLTAAEQALRRQHFRANNKAMHDWTTATRQNRRFSLPSVDPSDVSKLTGWIPSHVDALSALICALPFPLEVLRMFPVKKLLDFGHSINSQAQRALIRHHSADGAVSAQVRAFCKKWASAVDACPQGSARWSMTDNIKQWNRLEKLDDSLLTATVSRPIDPDKWAILNVDQWNAHWMAATVTLRGETVLLLNIYAPSTVFAREAFYRALLGLLSSHGGPILCGGDFNCTLNQMADRSHNTHNKVHESRELKKLLQKLDLVDTLEDDALRATDTRDVKAFHRQHHTYYYTLPSGDSASSRLDRWYCSNDHLDWVRSVYQSVAGPFSDHNGVTIRVAAPDKRRSIGKDFFEKAHDQLDELRGRYSSPRDYALATANWWDEAKIALRIGYLEAKKSYFARLNQGYKKKIQRLQRCLSESEAQMLDHSGGAAGDQNVELSQEFLTTATSIRRAIAECKSKWQTSKRDRIFREHMHHERKTSKSFYKRISTKFLDNTIFTLGGTATYGPMRSRELADDMGEGWKSIMQQAPTLQTDIDQILDPGTAIPPSDRLGFLLKPINSSEIKQAVKKCKRGKAHGPDELGNDWYRDHCDEITAYSSDFSTCGYPNAFYQSVSAASPLDYRPIALLNSDYKIFTRIFATRLRTVLPWLIHHMQAGFVPGRAIPTTIDVLLAAQQRATSDPAMSKAIALLLDFAKAYDSLDRSFLAQALQHLGFPLKFVHLVKVLHSQTTYKFIVNGFLSKKYNVTSGIRQGCPLAPLLFILALEVLYRKIEASDEIHGVELQAAGCATEVRLGGYADDTTIYLSDPKDISAVFAILDKYGAASGLRVNRHKSAVLPLNKEYSSTEESVSDIHVLQREEHCRYLGIQVGQTPSNASNWSKCIQALRVRLRLARLKTHSVANAQQLPLHGLVKQFIWGSRNGKPAKPWMKEEQAELKKMNGGLSVPNIRTELMTMSATAVSRWAITTSHIDQVIGEILLHNTRASSTYITPLDAIPRRSLQLRDNMWTTGAALCASLHSRPYEPRERDNVRWCYEHFKSTIVQTQWDGDVFQIDLSSKMSDRLPGIIAEGRKLRGTFCAEWLPYMTSTADGWLLDPNGSPYKLAHTSLSVGTAQLGDILRWEWIRQECLTSSQHVESPDSPGRLFERSSGYVLPTLTHVDTTLVKATHTVHSAMDCDIMATRDLNGQKVSFHAHPRFTRIVQLWGGNGRYNTTRSFYRQQVAATRTQIGKDTRDAAVNKAVHTAGSLWPGLQLIQWSELHNIPGITAYTAQTLLRLKANRLSMWNYEKADLSCSNPECSQVVQSSVQHLFWECPKAKLVWNYFYALWAKIGITPGHDPAIWIFSLDLPDTPRHAWTTIKRHIIGHKCSNEHLQDHLYSVAHTLWRYMSASLIQAIWCAHLRRMDSDPIESTAEMAIMMTRLEAGMRNLTRLAEAQAGDSDGHTVAAVLKAYVDCFLSQTDAVPLTPSDTRGVYLLFFDGGSRGNPGPGGTGSIIVRVHKDSHTASLIWAASMAYSRKDTTNNFAEYWGLIQGLREAQRSHFEPFECIGPLDSTDWHVYTRQVDDSRIASTSEDGTITTVLQQDGGLSRQPSHGHQNLNAGSLPNSKSCFQQSHPGS
ncbi:reverse transcriptase, partial [Globisporangium splendens]